MVRLAPLALVLLLATTAAEARKKAPESTSYVDEKVGYRLSIPDGWREVSLADAGIAGAPLLIVANDATDQVLVVSRIKGPTDGAWGDDAKFWSELESGVRAQAAGYAKLSSRKLKLGKKKIPAYDLWFRAERDGKPATFGVRFLFFRGYALSLVVDSPGKRTDAVARKIVDSFGPVD